MESKLFNYYSIDECLDVEKLYKELDKYVESGSLEYNLEDVSILKISDLDLMGNDIEDISKLLDSLDVFPYLDLNDEEGEDHFDSDDDYSDY